LAVAGGGEVVRLSSVIETFDRLAQIAHALAQIGRPGGRHGGIGRAVMNADAGGDALEVLNGRDAIQGFVGVVEFKCAVLAV
jgi:hypothetical protein